MITAATKTATIRFLGVAGYEITAPDGRVVYIDPFLDENPGAPIKSHQIERDQVGQEIETGGRPENPALGA